jgi:cystathionine beta-lyase
VSEDIQQDIAGAGGTEMRVEVLSRAKLRRRRSSKWSEYPQAVLPAWVAEMDFAVAPPIRAGLRRIVVDDDYGYARRDGKPAAHSVAAAYTARMHALYGWECDPTQVAVTDDLVQACYACIHAFSEHGDGVILPVPAYPPFFGSIEGNGRKLLASPMVLDGDRMAIDPNHLASLCAAGGRILLFCNPQNPTGRSFSREELEAIGRLAAERDLTIISDEIHADLVYPGHRHIPIATLGPHVAERTVTLYSATKSFNIPGLRCATIHFGSSRLTERFAAKLPLKILGTPGITGIDATVSAWTECDEWLDDLRVCLLDRRDLVTRRLASDVPEARLRVPEATYLAWIDFEAFDLPAGASRFFLDEAAVALNDGATFGGDRYSHFARLNFATSPAMLTAIMDRMAHAADRNRRRHNR